MYISIYLHIHTHTHTLACTHIHIYMFIYVYVCMWVLTSCTWISRGLPTCSSSTSSPAVTRHQQEMKRFLSGMKGEAAIKTRKQSLMPLNPGELSGELKDPDGNIYISICICIHVCKYILHIYEYM